MRKIYTYTKFMEAKTIFNDTPESYVAVALKKIESKFKKMFNDESDESLKKMEVKLESIDINKSPKLWDSITVKYSDSTYLYSLYLTISIEEAISDKEDKEIDWNQIDDAFIKFKKYRLDDMELVGELAKNIKIKDLSTDMLVQLNIETDEEFGDEENTTKIDVEDKDNV